MYIECSYKTEIIKVTSQHRHVTSGILRTLDGLTAAVKTYGQKVNTVTGHSFISGAWGQRSMDSGRNVRTSRYLIRLRSNIDKVFKAKL